MTEQGASGRLLQGKPIGTALFLLIAMWGFFGVGARPGALLATIDEVKRHAIEANAVVNLLVASAAFAVLVVFWNFLASFLTPRKIFLGTVLLALPLFLTTPLLSTDVFAYGYYGKLLTAYHLNPYTIGQSATIVDPFFALTRAALPFQTTYGPLWVTITGVVSHFFGTHLWASVTAYRIIGLASLLGVLCCLARLLRDHPKKHLALVLVGWNPVVLFEAVGGAHNDMFMTLFIVGALVSLRAKRNDLALLVMTAGILVKYIPILLLPFFLLNMWKPGNGTDRKKTILGIGASAIFIFAAFLPYWAGARIFRGILLLSAYTAAPLFSPLELLRRAVSAFGLGVVDAYGVVRLVGVGAFLFLYLFLLLKKGSSPAIERTVARVVVASMALLLLYFQPWYFLWLFPLIPFFHDRYWVPATLLVMVLAAGMYPL